MTYDYKTARFNEVSKKMAEFANILPLKLQEKFSQDPLTSPDYSVDAKLGNVSKKEIRATEGFELVKSFCKENNYKYNIFGHSLKASGGDNDGTIEEIPASINIDPQSSYVETNNRLQRWFYQQ